MQAGMGSGFIVDDFARCFLDVAWEIKRAFIRGEINVSKLDNESGFIVLFQV